MAAHRKSAQRRDGLCASGLGKLCCELVIRAISGWQRRCCFKLGLDVELRNVAVAIQCEQSGWRRSYLSSN